MNLTMNKSVCLIVFLAIALAHPGQVPCVSVHHRAPTVNDQTAAAASTLDSDIKAQISNFKGKVFLFAKNLDTGETYAYNGDERCVLPARSRLR